MLLGTKDLYSLLLDLERVEEDIAEQQGLQCYTDEYVGTQLLHDGEKVLFHISRFDHAFYTTSKAKNQLENKSILDRGRLARVRWIKPIILGNVQETACWEVPARSGRLVPPNRLYVLYEPAYVIWLEPREQNAGPVAWKFSSAYPTSPNYIRDKTRGSTCIWKAAKKSVP